MAEPQAEPASAPRGLRTGFTTGACATACVSAAMHTLLTGQELERVTIRLPRGERPEFKVEWTRREPGGGVTCAVIKDAGDDPDVTHRAEIRATVRLNGLPGQVRFFRGEGVGQVTQPGLGLEIGGPAINPVPRRMMTEHALERLAEAGRLEEGADITVSVKDGEAIARKTLNPRLGILGGISILGRTGIVYPYSTAAYVASIEQGIEVALHQGADTIVLSTGGQTEQFAMKLLPAFPPSAFVQMGDYVGKALEHCAKRGIARAILVGQIGKVSKLAAGQLHTHARKSEVNLGFLAGLAAEAGANSEECQALAKAHTARHAYELSLGKPWAQRFYDGLCRAAARTARRHVGGGLTVESWLFDFEGHKIGSASEGP